MNYKQSKGNSMKPMQNTKGLNSRTAKLTPETAAEVYRAFHQHGRTVEDIGAEYGIKPTTVASVKNRNTWREATLPVWKELFGKK